MDIQQSNQRAAQVLKDDKLFRSRFMQFWQMRLQQEFGFDVWKLPVCERCEGWALWDQGKATCPTCHHTTANPITVEKYYECQYNIDRSIHTGAPKFAMRDFHKETATVYGGEAGLADESKKIIVPIDKEWRA